MKTSGETPTILVIVGITGDLAKRKLLTAIERLGEAGHLPADFRIVGISRRSVSEAELLAGLPKKPTGYTFLARHLEMFQMDLKTLDEYRNLNRHLVKIERSFAAPTQKLFYLSVPAQISLPIIKLLGEAGFGKQPGTKLLPEKPFGADLESARELITQIKHYFNESQVYRIDHYLAKAMAQNLLVFRRSNSLFKRTWNKDFIERVEIIAAEKIGIEGRSTFYEQTGALRDFVQSHLMQLAALTLMELPPSQSWDEVPRGRLAALQALVPSNEEPALRGQYRGYAQEVKNPDSQTETFVSLTLYSADPRWEGVPISLTTGKALDRKCTEIRIHYRQEDAGEANQLVLRIQPKEGIELALWSKRPGYGRELEPVQLDFDYGSEGDGLPEAYEQVFLDAIRSDHTLFTSSEEVLASWQILEPVQHAWSMDGSGPVIYEPGSKPSDVMGRQGGGRYSRK